MRPDDIVGYRPHQAARILRWLRGDYRRPWELGKRPAPTADNSTLFPGGQVRHLTSFPDVYRPIEPTPVFSADPTRIDTLPALSVVEGSEGSGSKGLPDPSKTPDSDPAHTTTDSHQEPIDLEPIGIAPRTDTSESVEPDPPQISNSKENQVSTNVPSTEPEPIYLDELDPHTQRIIYSAMAQAPERGLGPSALFASRPAEPIIDIRTANEPAEPSASEPSNRRPTRQTNFARHEGHCTICNHPERDAIEQAFLHWWRPSDLAYQFKLGNRLVVYRHAHAVGLFDQRLARTQHALGYVVEQAQNVRPTADGVIRAVRALGCLDQDGRWREPRKEILITHQYIDAPSPALPTPVLPTKDQSSGN